MNGKVLFSYELGLVQGEGLCLSCGFSHAYVDFRDGERLFDILYNWSFSDFCVFFHDDHDFVYLSMSDYMYCISTVRDPGRKVYRFGRIIIYHPTIINIISSGRLTYHMRLKNEFVTHNLYLWSRLTLFWLGGGKIIPHPGKTQNLKN